jgi:hypothetical protein
VPLSAVDEVRMRDRLTIIPRWSFFAPIPGTSDYHLLVRDKLVGGTLSTWREVDVHVQPRTALAFLWNPDKRSNKALFDITSMLLQIASKANHQHETVCLSLPYLMLLNTVSSLPRSPFTVGRQFMLVKTDGPGTAPDALFVSNVHEL